MTNAKAQMSSQAQNQKEIAGAALTFGLVQGRVCPGRGGGDKLRHYKYHKPKKLTLRNDRIPVNTTSRCTKRIRKKKYTSFRTSMNTGLF
jgi:hypothetical protein